LRKEAKVGLLVLGGIALLLVGVNFLKGKNIFLSQREFVAFYDHIDGLNVSNPVTINGFKIGAVNKVELDPSGNGNIKVTIAIREESIQIPKNSEARISSSDLFGSKAVVINLGDDQEIAQPGDTLMSTIGLGLKEAVNQRLDPLQKKTEDVIKQFTKVLEELEKIVGSSGPVNIEEAFNSITVSIENLKRTTQRLDTLVSKHGNQMGEVIEDVHGLSGEFGKRQKKLGEALDNFISVSDDLASADLKGTILETKNTLTSSRLMLDNINKGKGSLGKMMKTDSLHTAVMQSVNQLENLLTDIRLNPDRYMHFSVFGNKEKAVSLTKTEESKLKKLLREKK
jgi:phospholipid/cholesterol/gamma-HCH transport system substrate-binding protein